VDTDDGESNSSSGEKDDDQDYYVPELVSLPLNRNRNSRSCNYEEIEEETKTCKLKGCPLVLSKCRILSFQCNGISISVSTSTEEDGGW
jgi:hypothetical protein